jgi:hypothetical protein
MNVKERIISSLRRHFDKEEDIEEFIEESLEMLKQKIDNLKESSEDEEGLLQDLIQQGIIPSFSFPLDVVKFEARGTKIKKGSVNTQEHIYAGTSTDLKVGLSSFSPGKIVVINKQSFKVEGVGPFFPINPINHVEDWGLEQEREVYDEETEKWIENPNVKDEWKYYHRCTTKFCGVVFKQDDADFNTRRQEQDKGGVICPNCRTGVSDSKEEKDGGIETNRMITPEVFRPLMLSYDYSNRPKRTKPNLSHWEMKAADETSEDSTVRKLGRASLPHPRGALDKEGMEKIWPPNNDKEDEWRNLEILRFKDEGKEENPIELITVNAGPNGWGYKICRLCGYIPTGKKKEQRDHNRPYAIPFDRIRSYSRKNHPDDNNADKKRKKELGEQARELCSGTFEGPFVFGHTFVTDLVLFRFKIEEPLTSEWDNSWFNSAITTVKEALITSTTEILGIMDNEISGGSRKVVIEEDRVRKQYIDIFLYDNVSGGAGLVRRIGSGLSEYSAKTILEATYVRLGGDKCAKTKDGAPVPCARVCMYCLLDFRNQRIQDSLNRPLGFQLINNLRFGETPNFEHVSIEKRNNDSTQKMEELIKMLKSLFLNLDFIIDDKKLIISKDNMRKEVFPYSILMGTKDLPDKSLNYKKININNEKKLITVPFEVINDSPHVIRKIVDPDDEDDDEDDFDLV